MERQLTIDELAEKSGVSGNTIWRIETGNTKRASTVQTAQRLVGALGLAHVDEVEWPHGIVDYRLVNVTTGKACTRAAKESPQPRSLRWWREKRDMSMSILAQKAGVCPNTIWKIENDYRGSSVNEQFARKLVDALGLADIDDVLWPHGITDKGGSTPGTKTSKGPAPRTQLEAKPKVAIDICDTCFCEKNRSGRCGCD